MIESREQRRRTTLLHRRKVAIVASLIIVAILAGSLWFIYDYFSSVYIFHDANHGSEENGDRSEYYIVKVNGSFAMYYDKEGKSIVKTTSPPGVSYDLFVTDIGTTVQVDPATGDIKVRTIPVSYHDNEYIEGEYLSLFEGIDVIDIMEIEVHNPLGEYSIYRVAENISNSSSDIDVDNFVIKNAPLTATNTEFLSYALYYAGNVMVSERLTFRDGTTVTSKDMSFAEYGLVAETRVDADGNEYEYTPSYYVVTTKKGEQYKVIIGDKLIDGSGYYIQCQDKNGELRDAVYLYTPPDNTEINGTNFENTIMGAAKNFLSASVVYPVSSTEYYDVIDFTIKSKKDGILNEIVKFSYVDLEDRTGTVMGIHPYVFSDDSYSSYHPNYDNIDRALLDLMDPTITDIKVIAPSDEQKAEYGLMSAGVDENGKVIYYYDSEHTISFRRYLKDEESGEKMAIVQTIYVSEKTVNGTYYTYTEVSFPTATEDSPYTGFKINMICEVSESTMGFVEWEPDDWVYPTFMQISLDYMDKLELIWNDYSATITTNNYKVEDTAVFSVSLTDTKDYADKKLDTFGALHFKDNGGNTWIITPQRINVYSPDGEELRPQSLHFEYNALGEQVHVMDKFTVAADGSKIYIDKDYVSVVHPTGKTEKLLRYHTKIFQKMFAGINAMNIVDSYSLTAEEEQALINDPEKHLLTIKITDNEGTTKTYSFYTLTNRKAYVVVDGIGGFYLQTKSLTKLQNDLQKFLSGTDIDMDSMD